MRHTKKNCIKIRQSIIAIFVRVLNLELAILVTYYLVSRLIDSDGILFLGGAILNIILLIYIYLRWRSILYEVTPEGIYRFEGVFYKKQEAYDLKAFREIVVKQNLIQKILGYGNVKLINPLLSKHVWLKRIPRPSHYAAMVERYRIDEVTDTGATDTFIPFR